LPEFKSPGKWTRLYRVSLILAGAIPGGLLLYVITRSFVSPFGEDVAAIWSWVTFIIAGYLIQRLLPKNNLLPVTRILLAIFASSIAAMSASWIFMTLVDFPVDSLLAQLALTGAATIILAVVIFLPIHVLLQRKSFFRTALYMLSGIAIPSGIVLVFQPFGEEAFKWIAFQAVVFGAFGGFAAVAFMLVSDSEKLR